MKFLAKIYLTSLLIATFLFFPTKVFGQSLKELYINLGTGGVTGVYYPVGQAICRLVGSDGETEPIIYCTALSSSGSAANINSLKLGDLDLALVQSDIQHYAYTGTEVFAGVGPNLELRELFALHSESFNLVVRDDANIFSFEDLEGKRVNLGVPGSGNRKTFEMLIEEFGWTTDIFASAEEFKTPEMASALCNNKIDAYIYVVGHPNASIQEAANSCSSHLVPVTGPKVDSFLQKYPYFSISIIPGGMYRGTNNDVVTFGPRATLMATTKLSDDLAYRITKALFDNLEDLKSQHLSLSNLTAEGMIITYSAPLHDGAVKYFKEKGLLP
ncbi:MAG: TAXI family TRAP transporter solute-binding subunit [Deltaproteobacteria bacterium]|jgi:TRAP transporter TAXI family solute receptor|nr:TAXI family TRAP transporter solute-binding subunit [Deltaproteobacteria bacterium]